MKGPTERQRYLMTYAKPPHSFWRVSGRSSSLIRAYQYQRDGSECLPSERELEALLKTGWIELKEDPRADTTDTSTGLVCAKGYYVWLTEAGQKALEHGR